MHCLFRNVPMLLSLIEYLDVETLLNFCPVIRSMNSLITIYDSSTVTDIAKSLPLSGYPDAHAPRDGYPSTLQDLSVFIRPRLPRKIAIQAVASDQPDPLSGSPPSKCIPPDDNRGNEIR